MAPGFSADCLETLEELAMEGRESFEEHGGGEFHYIPCLNASEEGMEVIRVIVEENLAGWVDISSQRSPLVLRSFHYLFHEAD